MDAEEAVLADACLSAKTASSASIVHLPGSVTIDTFLVCASRYV
jgi:hypothetical protein